MFSLNVHFLFWIFLSLNEFHGDDYSKLRYTNSYSDVWQKYYKINDIRFHYAETQYLSETQ